MSGTYQLLAHFAVAGMSLGMGMAAFRDVNFAKLIVAAILWLIAYFHFAEATWIPSWGVGSDAIERIGFATRGAGFSLIAFSLLVEGVLLPLLIAFSGAILVVVGRKVCARLRVGPRS